MNTRRSLLTFGALLAAFALLAPGTAHAQAPTGAISAVAVEMGTSTGSVVVTWTIDTAGAEGEMIEVSHRDASSTGNSGWSDPTGVSKTAVKHTITGLNYDKEYEARARVTTDAGNSSVWVLSSEHSTEASRKVKPGQPEPPVRVASPAVTARDAMLDVEWLEPASELDITLYRVYYTPKGGAEKEKLVLAPSTSTTLTSLMNGTEYTIEVAAESAAGVGPRSRKVMGTPMAGATPTPALPLFGAFALGAGVLAAGRARLRRREQRRLTR